MSGNRRHGELFLCSEGNCNKSFKTPTSRDRHIALNTMGAEEEFIAFTNAEEHILRIQILLFFTNERAIIIPLLDTV